jgi:hypothetical protein
VLFSQSQEAGPTTADFRLSLITNGTHFLMMEMAEGETLTEIIRDNPSRDSNGASTQDCNRDDASMTQS